MEDSILETIKKMLDITDEDTAFDVDVIMHINTALAELIHGGVGPQTGFRISDKSATWDEFVTDEVQLSTVIEYVYCKTKLVFDPPLNSFTCEALNKRADETYWRAYMLADEAKGEEDVQPD